MNFFLEIFLISPWRLIKMQKLRILFSLPLNKLYTLQLKSQDHGQSFIEAAFLLWSRSKQVISTFHFTLYRCRNKSSNQACKIHDFFTATFALAEYLNT